MKKAVKYILLGVVMYMVFLAGTLPAPWIYSHWLHARLGNWVLYGVQGTVWEGRATLARSGNLEVDNLHWDFHPLSLLLGRVEVGLHFEYAAAPSAMVVGRSFTGAWHADDVDLELPAERLTPLLRLPGAQLGGKLRVNLSELTVKQGRITAAAGSVAWEKAAVRKPVAVDLGTFTVDLKTTAEGVSGTLLDHGGAVQAQGILKLNADGKYRFTATFASRDPRQPLITQGLRLFGTPGPDGRVKYSAAGVVPSLIPGTV
ncbi:MAG: type II secretion system protein N [Gammaproteobacteria bacterium]